MRVATQSILRLGGLQLSCKRMQEDMLQVFTKALAATLASLLVLLVVSCEDTTA